MVKCAYAMSFYDLSKEKRGDLITKIEREIQADIEKGTSSNILSYFSNEDTYIRKSAYLFVGRLFFANMTLQSKILTLLKKLFGNSSDNVRQTVVNALGEIGKKEAEKVLPIFEQAMVDEHHSVRNAVIGSLKKMGEKNPKPILAFSKKFLYHKDPEIRRQAVHGIELRGRIHPEDVLPLLEKLQFEQTKRVRDVVVHVLGQISYKKGCLEKVISALKKWKNKEIVNSALAEILETHKAYEKFSEKSYARAKKHIKENMST